MLGIVLTKGKGSNMRNFAIGFAVLLCAVVLGFVSGFSRAWMSDVLDNDETTVRVVHVDRADQRDHLRIVRGPIEYVASPSCPTEDSCRVDYRAGVWYVIPTIP